MIFNIDARGHDLFPTGFYFLLHIDVFFSSIIQIPLLVLQCFLVIVLLIFRFFYWITNRGLTVIDCDHNYFDF